MNRRTFTSQFSKASGCILLSPYVLTDKKRAAFTRLPASKVMHSDLPFPAEKRVPLGWPVFPVPAAKDAENQVLFTFPKLKAGAGHIAFRISAAIDFRERKQFLLYLPDTQEEVGVLDCRYAHPFQPFEVAIDSKWIRKINRQGLALKTTEGETAWFYATSDRKDNEGLQPQLRYGSPGDEKTFFNNLYAMNSFSPFGWMGGCVQDALLELHRQGEPQALATLKKHLESYLDDQKGIIFENPHTVPLDGEFNSIEDFLPFAAIAALYPDHMVIQKAIDFCLEKRDVEGLIAARHITTEACYTLAYPLMEIARLKDNAALAQTAIDQLLYRKQYLSEPGAICQRAERDGKTAYKNWGRGVAWYLLGMVKTLRAAEDSDFKGLKGIDALREEFQLAASWVASLQTPEGLWYAYIDDPASGIDTSATGGIASALAWGCQRHLISSAYEANARKAYSALMHYLTPDGFLTHVSQINRGGEALQKSGYRVISQFGMGLAAQLKATLA